MRSFTQPEIWVTQGHGGGPGAPPGGALPRHKELGHVGDGLALACAQVEAGGLGRLRVQPVEHLRHAQHREQRKHAPEHGGADGDPPSAGGLTQ